MEQRERKIGILGAGGQADETASYVLESTEVAFRAVHEKYIDEDSEGLINILSPDEYQKIIPVVAAIGAPAVRRQMVESWPGKLFETVVAQQAYVDKSSKIGEGCIVAPRAVITTNTEIGKHTIINVAATIAHNCRLGEYVTVAPGAHIGGGVEIGDGVFVGIGAVIINRIKIAPGCVIGAGAVVVRDIEEENSVVVGSPAKVTRVNEGWLSEV